MAHEFILKPDPVVLSSNIGLILIHPDGNFVDVRLVSVTGKELLSERYYAYAWNIEILDLGSLIEDYMKSGSASITDFTLELFTDNPDNVHDRVKFSVIYCDRTLPGFNFQELLAENFLTTLDMRRVAQDFVCLSLFYFAMKGESIFYRLRIDYRVDGSDELLRYTSIVPNDDVAYGTGVFQVDLFRDSIVADLAKKSKVKPSQVTLVSLTLRLAQRSMTFYFDPSLRYADTFYFRNCFNALDFITLPGVTTTKTDVDRSTAHLNGRSHFYDQTTTETFEVATGPLTLDEAQLMSQLVSSHMVALDNGEEYPIDTMLATQILITDSTCEVNNGDDKPNTVKFTWRYADNRPIVQLPTSPGIFTDPYNLAYD